MLAIYSLCHLETHIIPDNLGNKSLPYSYEPWENGGYDAITFFRHNGDFLVDFWKAASKDYPELKFVAKYQQELAAAYICTIQAGKVVKHIRFDWNDGDVMSWSD